MDILQIASVTIYSKIINEILTKIEINNYVICILAFLFFIKQCSHTIWFENILNSSALYIFCQEESTLELNVHEKIYNSGHGKLKRQFYSEYYQALTYYLQHLEENEMSKFVEVMKINYAHYYEEETGKEYMLIPDTNYRTKICKNYRQCYDIFLEVKNKTVYVDKSNDKKDTIDETNSYFKFILITPGKTNFHILQAFMDELLDSYKKNTQKKKTHSLYEFMRSYNDEDRRDKQTTEYREFPFKSNKFLDKNVFFEGKQDFIQFIDRFCEGHAKTSISNDNNDNCIYEISGVTKKACVLLYGPPGCGKSCVIKGILNRTKRDGIIVPWSRLKTCGEFCSLFRSQKINDTHFELKNHVFIFEDFDANKSDILKQRKKDASEIVNLLNEKKGNDNDNKEEKKDTNETLTLMSLLSTVSKKTDDDELTLECVLNTLDGIAELQDAIIIFTTNHLEQIDPAFYRSGRVDYLLEMKLASVDVIRQMVQTYCQISDIDQFQESFLEMKDYKISTADVQCICFKYGKNDITACLKTLIEKTNSNN
jgi:hypothetical protein